LFAIYLPTFIASNLKQCVVTQQTLVINIGLKKHHPNINAPMPAEGCNPYTSS